MGDGKGNRKRWLVNVAISLIGVVGLVLGSVWAFSADRAAETKDVQANSRAIADHEARLRSVETKLTKIHTDVSWIRNAMGGGE